MEEEEKKKQPTKQNEIHLIESHPQLTFNLFRNDFVFMFY